MPPVTVQLPISNMVVKLRKLASILLGGLSGLSSGNNYFTPLIAGQSFTGDVRVCRFQYLSRSSWLSPNNQTEYSYVYGIEELNGSHQNLCRATTFDPVTPDPATTPWSTPVWPATINQQFEPATSTRNIAPTTSGSYQVMYVPRSMSIIWVTQRSFPNFPNMNPTPLSFKADNSTIFLARCKITVDENFDSSFVLRVPALVSVDSTNFSGSLGVSLNGIDYNCNQEDLEFPVCV